jgi:hypothetical protein
MTPNSKSDPGELNVSGFHPVLARGWHGARLSRALRALMGRCC